MMSVASVITSVNVNGPGVRAVVHFQGCTLGCKGCFNQHLWPKEADNATPMTPQFLACTLANIECTGYTLSGGEPFQQPDIIELLHTIRDISGQSRTILVFTGYTWNELTEKYDARDLALADCYVTGRYDPKNAMPSTLHGLRSSSNQRIVHTSIPHRMPEVELLPRMAEIVVEADGEVHATGFGGHKLAHTLYMGMKGEA